MNQTLDAIGRRYACRSFQESPVPRDTLKEIARAGLAAPSAMGREPWRFIVVERTDVMTAVGDAAAKGFGKASAAEILYGAPAMILVAGQEPEGPFTGVDVGIATGLLTVAATALGVQSCVVASPQAAFQQDPSLAARVGVPAGFKVWLAVLLGYEASCTPKAPHPLDPTKIICA
ncbi:MAG: nitroreductase family protein [Bifidobacteriaceae bacterium]|jgi:nitroreductase|nr:nitroreductase family protein [Bifidobacteriaceae bacterium]